MRNLLLFVLLAICIPMSADGEGGIDLGAKRYPPLEEGDPNPRSPIFIPTVSLDGYTLYIIGEHPDYVLRLADVDDESIVVYQTIVPANVNSVVLPSYLSGDYQIQLLWDGWMLYGWITL